MTGVYTIAPAVRTPEQVVSSFFDQTAGPLERPKPHDKHLWATLDGKVRLCRVWPGKLSTPGQPYPRQGGAVRWLRSFAVADRQTILRFHPGLGFHPCQRVPVESQTSLLGENNDQRTEWMKSHTLQMLSGQTDQLYHRLPPPGSTTQDPDRPTHSTPENRQLLRAQFALHGLSNLSVQRLADCLGCH